MAHTSVLGKNRSQVPLPYGDWSYVSGSFSASNVSATQRPMRLLPRRDGRFWGRFVLVRVIRRFSRFFSKATDMSCKRKWGAILCQGEGGRMKDEPERRRMKPEGPVLLILHPSSLAIGHCHGELVLLVWVWLFVRHCRLSLLDSTGLSGSKAFRIFPKISEKTGCRWSVLLP